MSKSEQVRELLQSRYQLPTLPLGALTLIANEVGCTREMARQVAKRLGYESQHILPRQTCPVCEKPARFANTLYCSRECAGKGRRKSNVVKTCDHCKNDYELTPAKHAAWRRNRKRFPSIRHTFCSKACGNAFWGATTFAARKAQP